MTVKWWLQGCSRAGDALQVVREPGAAAQHALLPAAGGAGRPPHRRGQRGVGDGDGVPACARALERRPGGGLEARRGCGARQGRLLLLPALAHRPQRPLTHHWHCWLFNLLAHLVVQSRHCSILIIPRLYMHVVEFDDGAPPRLETDEIPQMVTDFRVAARNAIRAGNDQFVRCSTSLAKFAVPIGNGLWHTLQVSTVWRSTLPTGSSSTSSGFF
jgi:hypothetical protein